MAKTATLTVSLSKLHSAQQDIVNSPARFKVVCCGRRFGKTELAIDGVANDTLSGKSVAFIGTTYDNVSPMWKRTKNILKPVISYKNENARLIELITGGFVEFWSWEALPSALGRKYHKMIFDEAARMPMLYHVFTETAMAMLTDYAGSALFTSTPRGHNDFWRLYNMGLDPQHPLWESFNYQTSSNPYISLSEIELAKQTLPQKTFEQEYLAAFVEDAGGVFRGVKDVATLAPTPPAGGDYVMGVDWAKAHDFTVLSIIDTTTMQQVHVERFNQVSWNIQRNRLHDLVRRYGVRFVLAESNSIGEPNIEQLQREGVPVEGFQTTALSKTPLIDDLALAIERQQIMLLNDSVQTSELQAYQMERLPSGKFRYNAPDGGHDDTVIALALAYRAATQSRRSYFILDDI